MFETIAKHFVYDFCIGLVFDKWNDNFVSAVGDVPKVGDYLSRVSHVISDEHYYGCVVKNVLNKTTTDGHPYFLVYIDYKSSQGVAIDEWQEEISEYLDQHDIKLDESELGDDEYEIVEENLDEIMNDEEIEYMEYPDMICINSLYYVFHR